MSRTSWWGAKVRRFRAHVGARVLPAERADLATWVSPAQLAVFDGMHVADKRHGLDVVATLRAGGSTDPELLLAGLLHDAGKGPTVGVWPRVAWSLGQGYGGWVVRVARIVPGFGNSLDLLRDHADASARLAEAAGCTPRTVDLIRNQADPVDRDAGRLLFLADEAN
ncbi:MAG TPA: hypothetical protein VK656_05330 [Candidatus Acidoferrum sp.]|nr:hypothetical protein [Candidatus Acidoferrum sp.]